MTLPTLQDTLEFVTQAHKGQMYNDSPYVFHLVRVASWVEGFEKKTIALLHDILEDTKITRHELLQRGYTLEIIKSIECLTKTSDMDYMDYIMYQVAPYPLIREIKAADILDHLHNIRFISSSVRRKKLLTKYIPAAKYLLAIHDQTVANTIPL